MCMCARTKLNILDFTKNVIFRDENNKKTRIKTLNRKLSKKWLFFTLAFEFFTQGIKKVPNP